MEVSPSLARRVGTVLREKWRLDSLLGSGGMAAVYAATHRNGMRAAIKILHPHLAENVSIRTRFAREGYAANRVAHSGVVRVLDDDVSDEGAPFLVMELLEGETLANRARRSDKRLPLTLVIDLGAEMLDVLAAAHDAGIVHRDVKPENVFLTNEGRLKLLDFGIARLREHTASTDVTTTSSMIGTPAFMPPEQALAKWDRVDHRSDLFAVGATMWTLLTGRHVHDAETVPELLVAASSQQARPIRSVMPGIPAAVAAVIDRALAFERAGRWDNARAMQFALRAAYDPTADTEPILDEPAVDSAPMAAFAARRRTAVLELSAVGPAAAAISDAPPTSAVTKIEPLEAFPPAGVLSVPRPLDGERTTFGPAAATPALQEPNRTSRLRTVLSAIGVLMLASTAAGLLVRDRFSYRSDTNGAGQPPMTSPAHDAPIVGTASAVPVATEVPLSPPDDGSLVVPAHTAAQPIAPAPTSGPRSPRPHAPKSAAPTGASTANGARNDGAKDPLEKFDL